MTESDLHDEAARLAERLFQTGRRIVFAESCTAGRVAATMARIPGISNHLCGSAVVYRNETKTAWLGVSAEDLANEAIGPVSEIVASAMARGVLELTPQADLAVSVTGHLGPDAPAPLDGVIYIGIARRGDDGRPLRVERVLRHKLAGEEERETKATPLRERRQREAAAFVLQAAMLAMSE
ncbi:MAG: nicotinamide-nucleotide amidohydrolase family protein [Planctomycetaceae bacterium]|nr:nicotinamide-nucleotide amidohydrolase family protein [Planctomycetaceae bacterium]